MIPMTFTSFVDFVRASDNRKVSVVKKAKRLRVRAYDGKKDYYMPLRSKLVSIMKGNADMEDLIAYSTKKVTEKRRGNYRLCVSGLAYFFRKHRPIWCGSISGNVDIGEFSIHVNPELGLQVDGKKYAAKVYFRKNELEPVAVDSFLYLISRVLETNAPDYEPAILLARSGTLVTKRTFDPLLGGFLESQAGALFSLWNSIDIEE